MFLDALKPFEACLRSADAIKCAWTNTTAVDDVGLVGKPAKRNRTISIVRSVGCGQAIGREDFRPGSREVNSEHTAPGGDFAY
jgi:hypothetical protein